MKVILRAAMVIALVLAVPAALEAVPAAVRGFANGKFKAMSQTNGDPDDCVAEIQVSK